ncbi:hypothetical protein BC936DRAFT_140714 [Jimgerdemannia flammicorona]|uniref:Uncharacterized protein n=2 Tax=Jimgerdemannia flammicorona TaxID=994334 RepID=A0A433QAY6_9FUNG|nr:hypothetical protein BC936DRAFT_140714 [Jimgerdemannia flammicorona]RUS26966.1 hypothetical protein BC938DRAFT_483880 [Jimgerdemannia flammicorona]
MTPVDSYKFRGPRTPYPKNSNHLPTSTKRPLQLAMTDPHPTTISSILGVQSGPHRTHTANRASNRPSFVSIDTPSATGYEQQGYGTPTTMQTSGVGSGVGGVEASPVEGTSQTEKSSGMIAGIRGKVMGAVRAGVDNVFGSQKMNIEDETHKEEEESRIDAAKNK